MKRRPNPPSRRTATRIAASVPRRRRHPGLMTGDPAERILLRAFRRIAHHTSLGIAAVERSSPGRRARPPAIAVHHHRHQHHSTTITGRWASTRITIDRRAGRLVERVVIDPVRRSGVRPVVSTNPHGPVPTVVAPGGSGPARPAATPSLPRLAAVRQTFPGPGREPRIARAVGATPITARPVPRHLVTVARPTTPAATSAPTAADSTAHRSERATESHRPRTVDPTTPGVDLDELTRRVLTALDRRQVAQRERLGRRPGGW